jgi:hypothetical protein
MPNDMAMFSPWIRASYSTALLEAGNSNWRAYLRCSPPGAVKRILALLPAASASHQNTFAILLQSLDYLALVVQSTLIRNQPMLEF